MFERIVLIVLIVLLIQQNNVNGKKQKKSKQSVDVSNHVPQPNVLTYSTFGFNDVGSHDGFVQSSPDTNNLNKYKEAPEKLYAPAFPSFPESDFTSDSQSLNEEPFASGGDGQQSSMLQYNPTNSYGSSYFNTDDDTSKNFASGVDYRQNSEDNNESLVYGTKISSTNKNTQSNGYNNTELNSGSSYQNNHKLSIFHELHSINEENKPSYSESNNNQNFYNFATTYPSAEIENSMKAAPMNSQSMLKFPKNVVAFTKTKPYDSFEVENKYSVVTSKPLDTFNSMVNIVSGDTPNYYEDHNNKLIKISPGSKTTSENKDSNDITKLNQNFNSYQGFVTKYSTGNNYLKNKKYNYENNDEIRTKPWTPENNIYDKKRFKNAMNGYDYARNFNITSYKLDDNEPKKQFNSHIDEIIPSSSNVIDFSNYPYSETGYPNFKNTPNLNNVLNSDSNEQLSYNIGNKYNPSVDYLNKFKNMYSTVPTSSTNWGNIFKSTDYSSYKTHIPKPQNNDEEIHDMVHIPKRPNNYRNGKDSESTAIDWPAYNKKPGKYHRPNSEWNKENFNNRFKSEEDLLGLRNHDTSHPSYLPTFQYTASEDPEESFKSAVEKWRENYIKSKYRDIPMYDYDASEAKLVPASNPFEIEVPHPVIVPVPRPYPVRIVIARPVAVPVLQEITVPIEKPVLYPVYKKVPYPIEKLVPVPVEKQISVPVVKSYPIPVPHVRPVFHHSRPYREEYDLDQDNDDVDDYLPRPETSKNVLSKRPKGTRNRSRRPSRMSHQERSKGRRPQRRPNVSRERGQHRFTKPTSVNYQRFRYKDIDFGDEREFNDYLLYCKRTGKC